MSDNRSENAYTKVKIPCDRYKKGKILNPYELKEEVKETFGTVCDCISPFPYHVLYTAALTRFIIFISGPIR